MVQDHWTGGSPRKAAEVLTDRVAGSDPITSRASQCTRRHHAACCTNSDAWAKVIAAVEALLERVAALEVIIEERRSVSVP